MIPGIGPGEYGADERPQSRISPALGISRMLRPSHFKGSIRSRSFRQASGLTWTPRLISICVRRRHLRTDSSFILSASICGSFRMGFPSHVRGINGCRTNLR